MHRLNAIERQVRAQNLIKIKKIVDKDVNGETFSIVRKRKNVNFMRAYGLNDEDVKDIIRSLSVEDCYSGPEKDHDSQYIGWIFKFKPVYEGEKLYIKIRIESTEKSVCLSVHEFGKVDEVD